MKCTLRALVVAASATSIALACTVGLNYPNSDFPHMPLPLPPVVSANASMLCESMCAVDPACVLSVLLPAGCDADARGAAVCYLKNAEPPSRNDGSCVCGGLVQRAAYPAPPRGAALYSITSLHTRATFDSHGLLAVSISGVNITVLVDTWAAAVDGFVFNSSALSAPVAAQPDGGTLIYTYTSNPYTFVVRYETRGDWRFLRKTLSVSSNAPSIALTIISVSPWDALSLVAASPLTSAVFPSSTLGSLGLFARFGDGSGLVAAVSNPFQYPTVVPANTPNGLLVHVGYHPAMLWNQTTPDSQTPTPFEADSGLLGLYTLRYVLSVCGSCEGYRDYMR